MSSASPDPQVAAEDIMLVLKAKGGETRRVKKSIVSCVKYITDLLEGTSLYI